MSNGDTPQLELIGSIVSSVVIITFAILILLIAISSASLSTIPLPILTVYAFIVALSGIQVVGIDVLLAYRDNK